MPVYRLSLRRIPVQLAVAEAGRLWRHVHTISLLTIEYLVLNLRRILLCFDILVEPHHRCRFVSFDDMLPVVSLTYLSLR